MFFAQWSALKQRAVAIWQRFQEEVKRRTKPVTQTVVGGAITDLARSKMDLVLENALLRQQLTRRGRQLHPRLPRASLSHSQRYKLNT